MSVLPVHTQMLFMNLSLHGVDVSMLPLLMPCQSSLLSTVRAVTATEKGTAGLEDQVKELRKGINSWVAKYRRSSQFAGRPSYGCGSRALCLLHTLTSQTHKMSHSAPASLPSHAAYAGMIFLDGRLPAGCSFLQWH